MMTDVATIPTRSSTSSAILSGRGWRADGLGRSASRSVRRSATRLSRRSGRPCAAGPFRSAVVGRSGADVQRAHPGLDQLLWSVLPVGALPDPEAHRCHPGAMGLSEVQGLVQAQDAGHPLAGAHCAPPDKVVRPLEPALWPRPNNGSRMTRECHVRFCESAGVRSPRATHLVVGFQHETDARRFLDMMRDRLEEFALTLHPEKTRLIEFGRYAASNRKRRGLGKPETFTFLGFSLICGTSRRGYFRIHRKSRRDRKTMKLKEIKEELRRRLHQSIPDQGQWLKQVVAGYFAYHAVPTNIEALRAFRFHVISLWGRALRRRSQKDGTTWKRILKMADDYLPKPRILHPWPSERFAVKHPR